MIQGMCVRCQRMVPADDLRVVAGGAMCSTCQVASMNDGEADAMVRALSHSTGRKEVIIGVVLIAIGLPVLWVGLSVGMIALLPIAMIGGGIYEIVRGISRLST
ncbi:MAG TPA: hypothetical protein VGF94_12565 [Kofleriaceae bacterium]|jgi:hypothetical protein